MSQQNNVMAGTEQIGAKPSKNASRTFPILAKDFTSVEQAVPLRLIYGTARVAAVQITPIFNFTSQQVSNGGGK